MGCMHWLGGVLNHTADWAGSAHPGFVQVYYWNDAQGNGCAINE